MVEELRLTVCTFNLDCTGIVTFSTLCHKCGFIKVTDGKHRFPSCEISVLVDLCATTVCSVRGRGCGSACLRLNGQHYVIDGYVPLPSTLSFAANK